MNVSGEQSGGSITCGDTVHEAVPGGVVFVPRGTPHRFEPGAEGGRMLLL